MTDHEYDICVIGGGAFGTALAHILASRERRVALWVRRPELAEEINREHRNQRYLPGLALCPSLQASSELEALTRSTPILLMAVPSRHFRATARQLGDFLSAEQIVVHATKGIEQQSYQRMSQVLREESCAIKLGVISGPNLANELVRGQPAGALVASRFDEVALALQAQFSGSSLRLYRGRDVIGTELAGAFKNIVALAAGAVDGLDLGDNAKAMLVTRGLSEMARFGVALGAQVMTFGGLAGIGDLMATCASKLSRNHQVGQRLARGESLESTAASMPHIAEGVFTCRAVHAQAQALHLELHIVSAVHAFLFEGWSIEAVLGELLSRPTGEELAMMPSRGA
ncbi:MAG: NAD(P)H-dependent glycerol-3-phosphate dehydrogenase [Myxococcota bacterium]|jgi:glycerol-3-phosphate dehydrogenase (NAD(P)+)|nr:NAD(P)H-dependent glycerol-3-phosphate dehydrogenase [Myxococcota bacterium]